MDIFVARQPIFDSRMNVFGYELFYRRSKNNFYEGTDGTQATSELINNAFLSMQFNELTNGTKAFINFSEDLIKKHVPLALPSDTVVVEILENIEPTEPVIEACRVLKDEGYILALDDFNFQTSYKPLIELADIVKIEYTNPQFVYQQRYIKEYNDNVKFLAEKVETREEYDNARRMGYDLFQGYFFSKPEMMKGKETRNLNSTLILIANELNKNYVDFNRIAKICERDVEVSYKIIKISNYLKYGTRYEVKSIRHALAVLGVDELKRWVYLMMFKSTYDRDNNELIKNSFIRGKLMELIAFEYNMEDKQEEFFITGLFSLIDVLLNRCMEDVIKELPFSESVKEALVSKKGKLWSLMDKIVVFEEADLSKISDENMFDFANDRFMQLYLEALKWYMEIDL